VNPGISMNSLDEFTTDTLQAMVRYIKDDSKIARHLRIDEAYVRRARSRLAKGLRRRTEKKR